MHTWKDAETVSMLENLNPEGGENQSGSLRHGNLQVNTCSCFRAVCPQVGNPRLCGPGPAAHAPLFTPVSLQSLSGLIYTSHMDAIRPPGCINLYLDKTGLRKENKKKRKTHTGDILCPTCDHVSGIKVEEVRGLRDRSPHMADLHHRLQKETN